MRHKLTEEVTAMDTISLALFVFAGIILTIGIGTVLGAMLPLIFQHPGAIPTPFGIVTIIGILVAIIGIILCTKAGNLRDRVQKGIAKDCYHLDPQLLGLYL